MSMEHVERFPEGCIRSDQFSEPDDDATIDAERFLELISWTTLKIKVREWMR